MGEHGEWTEVLAREARGHDLDPQWQKETLYARHEDVAKMAEQLAANLHDIARQLLATQDHDDDLWKRTLRLAGDIRRILLAEDRDLRGRY